MCVCIIAPSYLQCVCVYIYICVCVDILKYDKLCKISLDMINFKLHSLQRAKSSQLAAITSEGR